MHKKIQVSIIVLIFCLSITLVSASLTYNKQAIEQWLLEKPLYNTTSQLDAWYFNGSHTYNGNYIYTGVVTFTIPPWGVSVNGTSVTFLGIDNLGNGSYQWRFSDGTNYTTANLTGMKGDKGDTGTPGTNGTILARVVDLGNGSLEMQFDSLNYTTPNITGAKGDTGLAGVNGINGTNGVSSSIAVTNLNNGSYLLILSYSNGTNYLNYTTANLTGVKGDAGIAGTNGTNGLSTSVAVTNLNNGSYLWIFSYSNGTNYLNFTTSNLTGLKGDTGAQGIQGIQGIQGVAGVDGINGTNGVNGTNGINGSNASVDLSGYVQIGSANQTKVAWENITNPPTLGNTSTQINAVINGSYLPINDQKFNETQTIKDNGNFSLENNSFVRKGSGNLTLVDWANLTSKPAIGNTSAEIMATIYSNGSLYNDSNPKAFINISNLTNYQNCSINGSCPNILYFDWLKYNYTILAYNISSTVSPGGSVKSYCSSNAEATCYVTTSYNMSQFFGNSTEKLPLKNRAILIMNGSWSGYIYFVDNSYDVNGSSTDYQLLSYLTFTSAQAGYTNRPSWIGVSSTRRNCSFYFSVIEFSNVTFNATMLDANLIYAKNAYIETLNTRYNVGIPKITVNQVYSNMSTKYGGYGAANALFYWTVAMKDTGYLGNTAAHSIIGILNSDSNTYYNMINSDVSSTYGEYNGTLQYYYYITNARYTSYLGGYLSNNQDIDNVTNMEYRMMSKSNKLTKVYNNMKNLDIRQYALTGVSYVNSLGIIISGYTGANDTAIYIQGNSKLYLGDASSKVWFNNSYIQNDGNVTYFVTNATGLNGNTSGFAYFSGAVSATEYRTRTEVNNDSNVLDSLKLGTQLLNSDGSVNHPAFGKCYRSNEITDYARPVKIYHNYTYIERFKNETTGEEYNENKTGLQEEITYPFKMMTQEEDLGCMNARHEQSLALYHQVADVQQLNDTNKSEILLADKGIVVESLYMMSEATDYKNKTAKELLSTATKSHLKDDGSINYSSYGDAYIKLKFKDKINDTVVITEKDAVNLIKRLDILEAQIATMRDELCLKDKTWC